MIIKGKTKRQRGGTGAVTLLIVGLLILLSFRFDWISLEKGFQPSLLARCDMEDTEGGLVVSGTHSFGSATLRTDEDARSGKYAIKLDSMNRLGLKYIIDQPQPGKRYKLSVWSKNPHPTDAALVASAINPEQFRVSSRKIVRRDGNYWDKRVLSFQVPFEPELDYIQVFVEKDPGPNAMYFDDLEIRETVSLAASNKPQKFEPKLLEIQIDRAGLDYLNQLKKKSIAKGLIYQEDKKIEIKVLEDGEFSRARLRYKGDWLDHLSGYPSYRIDMDGNFSWNGMQSFSVQDPTTRGMLRNWVFGQFLEEADILHPRTDFILMKQNRAKPFVFSYEEHFTKNLLESQARREGPILKFMETRLWDITGRHMKYFKGQLPDILEKEKAYWAADIRAFKESKILNNPVLKDQYELAQNLMLQYKYRLKPAAEIFDLERLARYLALVDICLAHHAVTWHNQRFYYNPVTSLLEPIGFDGYTSEDPNAYASAIWNEEIYNAEHRPYEPLEQLFYEEEFVTRYFKYLYRYSDPDYISMMLDKLEEGIRSREKFLQERFKGYRYDRTEILEKAKIIRRNIYPSSDALRIYHDEEQGYLAINNHAYPLWVYGRNMNDSTLVITGKQADGESYYNFPEDAFEGPVRYKVVGMDSVFFSEISDYTAPGRELPRQKLESDTQEYLLTIAIEGKKEYLIPKGNYIIDQALVIPRGKKLIINAGVQIKFRDGGFILSHSSLDIRGTVDEPVFIECEDGKSGSITVLQADSRSKWQHVLLQGQNTLNYRHWKLTGAVNFYESDVDMSYVRFDSNLCEDALNIIRSEFSLDHCQFQGSFSDAFDADFCSGTIDACIFIDSGNDAMDFSGSTIKVRDTQVIGAGDKGVSTGEASRVQLEQMVIKAANIALASKDRSVLEAGGLDIRDCMTGFTAFQKKPEYGPATIILGEYTLENVKRDFIIEEKSVLERVYQ